MITIEIKLEGIEGADTALTDFIEELFITEDVQFAGGDNSYYSGANIRLLVKNYEMPDNADVNNLLDKCVLLNTYLSYYFNKQAKEGFSEYLNKIRIKIKKNSKMT